PLQRSAGMRALILDSGNTNSHHVARSIHRAGHRADLLTAEDSLCSRSRYCDAVYRAPAGDDRAYLATLLRIARRGEHQLFLACGDREAQLVHEHRNALLPHADGFLPAPRAFEIAQRKRDALRHAMAVAIPTPWTRYLAAHQLPEAAARIGFPVVVKGDSGSAADRVRYACN